MFDSSNKNLQTLIDYLEGFFVGIVFRLIFGLALIYFLWNVYSFIKNAGNAEKRKEHQNAIMWSIVALAVMMSLWALVSLVAGSFGEPTVLPQIDGRYIESF